MHELDDDVAIRAEHSFAEALELLPRYRAASIRVTRREEPIQLLGIVAHAELRTQLLHTFLERRYVHCLVLTIPISRARGLLIEALGVAISALVIFGVHHHCSGRAVDGGTRLDLVATAEVQVVVEYLLRLNISDVEGSTPPVVLHIRQLVRHVAILTHHFLNKLMSNLCAHVPVEIQQGEPGSFYLAPGLPVSIKGQVPRYHSAHQVQLIFIIQHFQV